MEDFPNKLSVCYRCDAAIEPLTSEQWFVAVDKKIPGRNKTLKQLATQAVKSGDINILPDMFKKTYYHWMDNLHDWCISRQIWWGHRIPVWYDEQGKVIVSNDKPKGKNIKQDPDTLDTWFSSALWTFSTLGWPAKTKDFKNFHPTQVMETGYDILFFWVARMILMTEYLLDDKPFETVYLHGMIRDKEGKKMSKSLGNGIDPIDMINKFGTDALRLSLVIGSSPGADLNLYEEKIAGYRNFVNKLWNISRFIFTNIDKIERVKTRPKPKTLADKWILAEFDNLVTTTTQDLDNYKFSQAGEKLYEFTWAKLADWYLEIAKLEKGKEKILLYILERLLILWHPFTPFITEVIWEEFDSKNLLLVDKWPVANKPDNKAIKDFTELQNLVTKIRNLKADNKIPPKDLPDCKLESKLFSKQELENISKLCRVNLVNDLAKAKKFVINQTNGWINLAKAMNPKQIADLEKYIKSLEAKLANKKFIKNAPPQVIEQNKQNLIEAKKKLD